MNTYIVNGMVNRPTFVQIEIDADSPAAAEARAGQLLEEHVGPKWIEDFDEMIGMSEGGFDGFEILDVEDVSA